MSAGMVGMAEVRMGGTRPRGTEAPSTPPPDPRAPRRLALTAQDGLALTAQDGLDLIAQDGPDLTAQNGLAPTARHPVRP